MANIDELKKRKPNSINQRCDTHKPLNLGMLQWYTEMERREKKRMKQKQCKICKHWFFKDEM
jgi:hypothetical protein